MVSFPAEFLKKIDEAAKKEHRSRSEFLREAARYYLARSPFQEELMEQTKAFAEEHQAILEKLQE